MFNKLTEREEDVLRLILALGVLVLGLVSLIGV